MRPAASRPLPASPSRKAPGLHLLGDLHGCQGDARLLRDAAQLEQFCRRAVADTGLTAVGALFHSFGDDAGVTGVVVLAESHLSVHTWPEDGYVTLDVYVCSHSTDNRAQAQQLFDTLTHAFAPSEARRQQIDRD
jgi:S-adenosylmethionine decarboxylase